MLVKIDKESLTVFGYVIRYEILILIGVLYLIIFGHTICSCTKLDLKEEFDMLSNYLR